MTAAKKSKVVTAPLVIAKDKAGADVYLYAGAPFLPDGLAEGEEKRLEEFLGDADSSTEK
jgi:hypothetical protein